MKSQKEGALGVEEATKKMKVGRLGMQEERERVGGTCHWCGQKDSQRGSHQQHHCPDFFQRAVQASHALLKGLVNHEGWARMGVADVEAWYVIGAKRLWVRLVPDGSLGDYVDEKKEWEVVLFSWSGQFFSTGPWTVDRGASPVDQGPLLRGWSNKAQAHKQEESKNLRHGSDTWRQDTNPRHRQQGAGAPVSLEVSVMVSWVARG